MNYDAHGTYVIWIDYGVEGWKPHSFDTVREALEFNKNSDNWILMKRVKYDAIELRE